MDEVLLAKLNAFYAARAEVRNYVEYKVNVAKLHKIEATKNMAEANLATDELNEESPEPDDE